MKELILRCQQGDRESMGQLYLAMHDELLAQCRKYAVNDSIAEDLLHDAFLLIFSNIDQLRSPEKGVRWMHKVAKNVCLVYVQHQQNHPLVSIDEIHETAESTGLDMPLTYDDILRAIEQLPRGYRQVFRLSVLEGMTHQQIAKLLGIEPHTSSSQLLRAKRQLRQMLQVLMLFFLAAIPFVGYYFWSLQNGNHDVAEVESTTIGTQEADTQELISEPSDQVQVETAHSEDANIKVTKSLPNLAADQITISEPKIEIADSIKAEGVEKADNYMAVAEKPLSAEDTVETEKQPTPTLEMLIPGIIQKTEKDNNLFLSLAYSGLSNGTARSLPYGAEGANGDIDTVVHHRLPMTIALNGRYCPKARWWLDGGIRYTLLSSEMRVGNTYLYMEQQQRVRYLGLSLGVGYEFWRSRHWGLYSTASVVYELPLRSTLETSYWQGGRLIDTENVRLNPHVQWSIGAGLGLQYDITPAIGLFAEPSLQYYFHNGDGIKTWRTAHPFTPMLPFGIRISF